MYERGYVANWDIAGSFSGCKLVLRLLICALDVERKILNEFFEEEQTIAIFIDYSAWGENFKNLEELECKHCWGHPYNTYILLGMSRYGIWTVSV